MLLSFKMANGIYVTYPKTKKFSDLYNFITLLFSRKILAINSFNNLLFLLIEIIKNNIKPSFIN